MKKAFIKLSTEQLKAALNLTVDIAGVANFGSEIRVYVTSDSFPDIPSGKPFPEVKLEDVSTKMGYYLTTEGNKKIEQEEKTDGKATS